MVVMGSEGEEKENLRHGGSETSQDLSFLFFLFFLSVSFFLLITLEVLVLHRHVEQEPEILGDLDLIPRYVGTASTCRLMLDGVCMFCFVTLLYMVSVIYKYG